MSDIYLSESFLDSYHEESKQQRKCPGRFVADEESTLYGSTENPPRAVQEETLIISGLKRSHQPLPKKMGKGLTRMLKRGLTKGLSKSSHDGDAFKPEPTEFVGTAIIQGQKEVRVVT